MFTKEWRSELYELSKMVKERIKKTEQTGIDLNREEEEKFVDFWNAKAKRIRALGGPNIIDIHLLGKNLLADDSEHISFLTAEY